jgi:small subunit ribosomal protein S18
MAPRKMIYKKRNCQFTEEGVVPDYKDITRLRKLVSDRGKIIPKARSGTTSKYQRQVSIAVKRARHLALLPFVSRG